MKKEKNLLLTPYAKIVSATAAVVNVDNPCGQVQPAAKVRISSRVRYSARTSSLSKTSSNESTTSVSEEPEPSKYAYVYEFNTHNAKNTRNKYCDHQGCIFFDSPEDKDVEFSLLLMTVNTPEWLQHDNLEHHNRVAYVSRDKKSIHYEAWAIAPTWNGCEYRHVGFADIHDRTFFLAVGDGEVYLV
jgi:hypothetical protein